MNNQLLPFFRCPVTRSPLRLLKISDIRKRYNNADELIVCNGILFADDDWFYPVIDGIPRLIIEAFLDYETFFVTHLQDYHERREKLLEKYGALIRYVTHKNRRTKKSFELEWGIYDYENDKMWNMDRQDAYKRFLIETAETDASLNGKLIFDAGCGNGLLNQQIANAGATIIGIDLSKSIERAFKLNTEKNAVFLQGDVQFPPFVFGQFDIVHSSGVLICTNNTELSFSCIEPFVKHGGKLSVWLYQPRKDFIHNLFNQIRKITSKMPIRLQYYLYLVTLFPASFVVKRMKGNKENAREMMINILDWFSPEFRWEHEPAEAASWFVKRDYRSVAVTTSDLFGFNITGVKNGESSTQTPAGK